MSEQLMLEQFEAAFQAAFPTIYKAAKAGESAAHGDMSCARWGWMASRAAVMIELPTACAYEGLTEHLGCVIELTYERPEHDPVGLARISDVRAAIEAHGLKVAP
ncbi:hypothetical protein [Pseudomonas juntendi]|uniref:hypothetical protein n=1 Tax=Pseudomonas juntendi TaxID=2666183 RepID=UPI003B959DBD